MAITVLAAALRFSTLDVQSVWLDEASTIHLVRRGLGGMLSHLSHTESTPPLYYLVVWLWTKVFGSGPIAFRALSALVGTATVPVVYAAGRRLSPRAGLWCAALAALDPIMLYYSQEARAYALLILFCAAGFVVWQRLLENPTRGGLAAWGLLSILALLTHYFAAFLLLPEALILARRLGWRPLVAPVGAMLAVAGALAPLAISQRRNGQSDWIASSSLASRFLQVPKQFLIGLYGPLELFSAAAAGVLAAIAVGLLWRHAEPRQRRLVLNIAAVIAVALIVPALLAASHAVDVFNGRNLIEVWTPCAVLVGAGLAVSRPQRWGTAIGAALCLIFVAVIVGTETHPAYQRDDWRAAARSLRRLGTQARVVVTDRNGSIPLSIYLPSLRSVRTPQVTTREIDFVSLRTPRTARSPLAPSAPGQRPAGFTAASGSSTSAYAIHRFVAAAPAAVSVASLRRAFGVPRADVTILP